MIVPIWNKFNSASQPTPLSKSLKQKIHKRKPHHTIIIGWVETFYYEDVHGDRQSYVLINSKNPKSMVLAINSSWDKKIGKGKENQKFVDHYYYLKKSFHASGECRVATEINIKKYKEILLKSKQFEEVEKVDMSQFFISEGEILKDEDRINLNMKILESNKRQVMWMIN